MKELAIKQQESWSKEGRALYVKTRREVELERKESARKKGFVTKSAWELVTGWSNCEGWGLNSMKKKYLDKFEYFRGTHDRRDRR